jgi:peptidoglycan/xylan/chitin deacetylase (PgdA/CDA1 family)
MALPSPRKKTLLPLLLALALGAAACLACGSSESTPPAPDRQPDATPASGEETSSPTTTPTAPRPEEAPPTPTVQAPAEDEAALATELTGIALEPIVEVFGEGARELTAHAFPLGIRDTEGAYWAVVTNGPQPFLREEDGNVINFFHIVALYRRNADASWSERLAELTLETAPHRTHTVEVLDPGPLTPGEDAALIAIRGETGAHGSTFDVLLAQGRWLKTVASHISGSPDSGSLADLDGDGVVELIFNTSNAYVFCYVCAVQEKGEQVYRWTGVEYEAVPIEAPEDLDGDLAASADRVVQLATANLWRDAAMLAIETSRRAPEHRGLRWLSIVVNRMAATRLAHAGSGGQPLLTNVLAGEYGAAYALMRALSPGEAFSLDGPLISGTAAETDLPAMVSYLLFYADEALKVRDDDAAIHAVRALGQVLASPDALNRARSSIGRALRLAPDDPFLQEARTYLESIGVAPGLPPDAPDREALLDAPDPSYFEEYTIGTGDQGRRVRALHQRLARVAALGFQDPGRYYQVYDEATRQAVLKLQVEAGLPPTGVVDGPTWEALEQAVEASSPAQGATPSTAQPSVSHTAHGSAGEPVVYLTFDDGPHPTWTPRMLDVLARHGVRATFFVLGQSVEAYPELTVRLVEEGHDAENHTFDHASLDRVDRRTFISEVEETDRAIREAVGERVVPTTCLRPPYGAYDAQTSALATELGKTLTLWNVDPQDWRRPGAEQIAEHLLTHARPGAILLMHDGGGERSQTVEALDTVLRELAARGYTFALLCR